MIVPGRDTTPFTNEQLAFLEEVAPLVDPIYQAASSNGVELIGPDTSGRYAFTIDSHCLMTTTNVDLLDHRPVLKEAAGRVLLTGLGMGLAIMYANANPAVETILVVEKDQRVIDLIEPLIRPQVTKPLTIIKADADIYEPSDVDWAFLDHSYAQLPEAVVERYRLIIPTISYWYENRLALEAGWR